DGIDGYDYITSDIYDIVILDVMLPSMNGFDILRKVREDNNTTTILMLTAKSLIEDRVQGLDYGADDYLTKPFANEELLARLRALSRRKNKVFEGDTTQFGDITFDKSKLEISRGTKSVTLTHLEFELLDLLISRKGMITPKETIITKLWGYDTDAQDNNVEVYISFLRKKIRFVSENVIIKTTRNVGYNLEVTNDV
ncbi:response regulator transcription factor, partial [Candidatus Izimaplasma bacterium]|nr:response regulator transcription factor [Candidatus Izimaplasma bacterium]